MGVASLEGDSLVAFYYLSTSEIWPGKRGGPLVGVASLERDSLVAFYYLSTSEIWPGKRGGPLVGVASLERDSLVAFYISAHLKYGLVKGVGLWWEWPLLRGTV